MIRMTLILCFGVLMTSSASAQREFSFRPAGELQQKGGDTFERSGYLETKNFVPAMRFPLESAPAFSNSQVYGHGGKHGGGGRQCDIENYQYPWIDNYCEPRSWDMPLCPSGTGHQGQDIRAATCEDNKHWAVATADGRISSIGSYTVYLTAENGTVFRYLHLQMDELSVELGDRIKKGQRIGRVSNDFGDTSTTYHLHFDMRQAVDGEGSIFVPTYMALVESYQRLLGGEGTHEYAAKYAYQSFPLASQDFPLAPGATFDGVLEMKNIGTKTWKRDEIFLETSNPRSVSSKLASDWISSSRVATLKDDAEPGEKGRFEFSVRAPLEPGEYRQFFNLIHVQDGKTLWFSDASGLPKDDQIELRVEVCANGQCAESSDAGMMPPEPSPDDGCSCRASTGAGSFTSLFFVCMALFYRRRRSFGSRFWRTQMSERIS